MNLGHGVVAVTADVGEKLVGAVGIGVGDFSQAVIGFGTDTKPDSQGQHRCQAAKQEPLQESCRKGPGGLFLLRRFMLLAQRGQKAASSGRGAPQKGHCFVIMGFFLNIESFTQLFKRSERTTERRPRKDPGLAAAVVNTVHYLQRYIRLNQCEIDSHTFQKDCRGIALKMISGKAVVAGAGLVGIIVKSGFHCSQTAVHGIDPASP